MTTLDTLEHEWTFEFYGWVFGLVGFSKSTSVCYGPGSFGVPLQSPAVGGIFLYNVAYYSCQAGLLQDAVTWLEEVFRLDDNRRW